MAICTWNRSRLLRRTLERLCEINTDGRFSWELILVNNHSTDDTAQVIDDFSGLLPIVSLFEPVQGLTPCRNRAVAEASGDYVVWTDNDVLVCKNWLVSYVDAFEAEPEVAFFGGAIEPWFEPPGRPEWIESTWEKCKPVYAARDIGETPVDLTEDRLPYGANFAIRTDFQRVYLYDPMLGRVRSAMIGGEETHVLEQIARAGGKGRWVPNAKVQHIVPADRATERYIRSYYVGQGQANVLFNKQGSRRMVALLDASYQSLLYRLKRHRKQPDEWVSHMIRACISWGEFTSYRSRSLP
ncbi:glycosyltransferase [Novipirellula artificiosorum]|uniref:glycosyltransferase n=1 Tax=Novipirellula artificiosorum TaxID=2528016 RepID=UPI0018CEF966|nr:glycosyltransferase [Novipirellula artificiosorum]